MNQETILWIFGAAITICTVVGGGIAAVLWNVGANNREQISRIWTKCGKIETDVEWVKSGIRIMGEKMGVLLHSPHTPEFDALIEKFWHGTLDEEEAKQLISRLEMIIDERPDKPLEKGHAYSPHQKTAAAAMLVAVRTIHLKPDNDQKNNQ